MVRLNQPQRESEFADLTIILRGINQYSHMIIQDHITEISAVDFEKESLTILRPNRGLKKKKKKYGECWPLLLRVT